jgi:hypothetical protein
VNPLPYNEQPPIAEGYDFRGLPENYVYVWLRPNGQPFYVGVGRKTRYKSLVRRNPHTLSVIKIIGGISAVRKVIYFVDSWEAGCLLEKYFIAKFGRSDLNSGILTNMTDGGEGTINKVVSEETKEAVAKANRNRIWTDASKKKTSEALVGREVKEATREKLRIALTGKSRPKYVLDAMREGSLQAIKNGTHGWINSEGHKQHFREKVQPKALEWHSSSQGRSFHSQLGKKSWSVKKASNVTCQFCGNIFQTPFPTRAKFCHQNCKQSARRLSEGKIVGTRSNRKKTITPKSWTTKKS